MKNMKKKVFVVALAVALVAILSMGTLAWFSDSDTAVNEFLVADSEDNDPDDIFSVDLYEKEDTDGDGVGDTVTDDGITYDEEDVLPGAELSKEAYVENTGSYDQYVRVVVSLSDITTWKDVLGITSLNEVVDLNEFFVVADDFDTTWYRNDADTAYDAEADTLTYVYYYNGVLAADEVVNFLEGVVIPSEMTADHVVALEGSFNLSLVAEAVQASDMLDTYGAVEYQNAIDSFAVLG